MRRRIVQELARVSTPATAPVHARAEDIADAEVRMIQRLMLEIGVWHVQRAAGRPGARFRYPGPEVQITSGWGESFERFCLNAEAIELAKKLPKEATPFLVYVALCESGHAPERCTLDDLTRPHAVGAS